MTKKKNFPKRPGPKLSHQDRVRVQLASDFMEADPNLKSYPVLRHACVLHSDGLPEPLLSKLKKVPKTWNVPFDKYLNEDELANFELEINRLNKALKKERTWIVDTSSIEGALDYDPEVTAQNEAMSKNENEQY